MLERTHLVLYTLLKLNSLNLDLRFLFYPYSYIYEAVLIYANRIVDLFLDSDFRLANF